MTQAAAREPKRPRNSRRPEDTAAGCRALVASARRLMEQATNPILRRRFGASAAAWQARADLLAAAETEFARRIAHPAARLRPR